MAYKKFNNQQALLPSFESDTFSWNFRLLNIRNNMINFSHLFT